MCRLILFFCLCAPISLYASRVQIDDQIATLPSGGGEIDDWIFFLPIDSQVSILATSVTGNPEINLFDYNPTLRLDDFLANDDDSGGSRNSFLNVWLSRGNYRIRISEWDFGNDAGTDPIILADTLPGVGKTFSYSIFIEADQVFLGYHPVAEPPTYLLFTLGLFYLLRFNRKPKSRSRNRVRLARN